MSPDFYQGAVVGVFSAVILIVFVDWLVGGIPRSPQIKDDKYPYFPEPPGWNDHD